MVVNGLGHSFDLQRKRLTIFSTVERRGLSGPFRILRSM